MRNASQNTQLHLRIIAAHKIIIACARNENAANLFALLRARWDVLQVRVSAGQASCNRNRLLEMRMDTSRLGINKRLQAIQIRALQLGQLAMLQNGRNQRMLALECLQNLGICRIACFRLFDNRQLQTLKKNNTQLLGRLKVELLASLLHRLLFQLRNPRRHILIKLCQKLHIRRNAAKLHLCQHRCQRQLQLLIQSQLLIFLKLLAQLHSQKRNIFAICRQHACQITLA